MKIRTTHTALFLISLLITLTGTPGCLGSSDEFSDLEIENSQDPLFRPPWERPPPPPPLTMDFDANGDGYADLAVVSQGTSHSVYVYYGRGDGSEPTRQIIKPPWEGELFIQSIAAAGDVNRDGYSDLIIGNPGETGGGQALIYHGSSKGLLKTPSTLIHADDVGSEAGFGCSVRGARDINDDGFSDVIVASTAERNASGLPNAGAAWVFYGSPFGVEIDVAHRLDGTGEASGMFGLDLDTNDVNNDGFTDVIIAQNRSIFYPPAGGSIGRVHVFLGGTDGIQTSASQILSSYDGDRTGFGHSVSSAGDFNGDGYGDIIVGADRIHGFNGRAYLYLGRSSGLNTRPAIVFSAPDGREGYFGWALTSGDFDDDGFTDIVVGETDALDLQGRAHVFLGEDITTGIWPIRRSAPELILTGDYTSTAYFGQTLACPGDTNGDGFDDIGVGAPWASSQNGRVHLFTPNYNRRRLPPWVIGERRFFPSSAARVNFGIVMM